MKQFVRVLGACGLSICLAACGARGGASSPSTAESPESPGKPPQADASAKTLSVEQQSLAGIELRPLAAARISNLVRGQATVLGHDTIAQAVADVRGTEATAAQSAAALKRIQGLQSTRGALGEDALEIARRQAAVDIAQRDLARRRTAAQFGAGSSRLSAAQWEALADGRLKLIRVVIPVDTPIPSDAKALRFVPLDGSRPESASRASMTWLAPAEGGIPGVSMLALVEGNGLAEGARMLAEIDQATAAIGVLLPQAAVVMHEGKLWCFVDTGAGEFTRRAVDERHPSAQGFVQEAGFKAGERVVVRGAGLLLAREFGTAEDAP